MPEFGQDMICNDVDWSDLPPAAADYTTFFQWCLRCSWNWLTLKTEAMYKGWWDSCWVGRNSASGISFTYSQACPQTVRVPEALTHTATSLPHGSAKVLLRALARRHTKTWDICATKSQQKAAKRFDQADGKPSLLTPIYIKLQFSWTKRDDFFFFEINSNTLIQGLLKTKQNFKMKLKLQCLSHLMWRANMIGKEPDAGKDWRQKEEGTTEDEMVRWHHRHDGREIGWNCRWWGTGRPGVLQSMGSQRVGYDWETELNWTDRAQASSEQKD